MRNFIAPKEMKKLYTLFFIVLLGHLVILFDESPEPEAC